MADETQVGRVGKPTRLSSPTEPQSSQRLGPTGFDPSRCPPKSPYLATSKAHMEALAREWRLVENHAAVMAGVAAIGLMRAPWPLRLSFWWRTKVRKDIAASDLWRILLKRFPAIAHDWLDQTADWIANGKDVTDPRSAGGFNQREIDAIYGFLLIDLRHRRDSDGSRNGRDREDGLDGEAATARAEGIAQPESGQ